MSTKGLEGWVHKFTHHGMPVAGRVINEINKLTGNSETQLHQLTDVVLRDPNLTSQVLRVANSVSYNYGKSPVSTVSRAIVLIGLKGTRALCISLLLIDSMLGKKDRHRLMQVMGMSFHAATQARVLVSPHDESVREEVFIAALLFNLGEMAYWTTEKETMANKKLYDCDREIRRDAMDDILGCTFKNITRALSKQWRLGETLDKALNPGNSPEHKIVAVLLADKVSRLAQQGWDTPAMQHALVEIARFTGKKLDEALHLMKDTTEEAIMVAQQYGAGPVCEFIPSMTKKPACHQEEKPQKPKMLSSDPHLQLSILRELTKSTSEKVDADAIFQMVIEGMHRGVGLERVCIAFAKNHHLTAKYTLGHQTKEWVNHFDFDIGPYAENIFTCAMENAGAIWNDTAFIEQNQKLYSAEVTKVLGETPSLLYTLDINDKRVGLFYADRGDLGGVLSQEQFDSFHHFAVQAQLALAHNYVPPESKHMRAV